MLKSYTRVQYFFRGELNSTVCDLRILVIKQSSLEDKTAISTLELPNNVKLLKVARYTFYPD